MERYSHLCPTQALIAIEKDLRTAITFFTILVYYQSRIDNFMNAMENEQRSIEHEQRSLEHNQRSLEHELAQITEGLKRSNPPAQGVPSDKLKLELEAHKRRLAVFMERMKKFRNYGKHLPVIRYIVAALGVMRRAVEATLVLKKRF